MFCKSDSTSLRRFRVFLNLRMQRVMITTNSNAPMIDTATSPTTSELYALVSVSSTYFRINYVRESVHVKSSTLETRLRKREMMIIHAMRNASISTMKIPLIQRSPVLTIVCL